MNKLAECVRGRIDELNDKFKEIILSSSGMFARIPFVPLEHKDAGRKCTTIVNDIEFERGCKLDYDTLLPLFNNAAYSIVRRIERGMITDCGFAPEMNSVKSICEEGQLIVQKPHSKAKAHNCINYLITDIIDANFIIMSDKICKEVGVPLPDGFSHIRGVEVFENPHAEGSVYAGKRVRDGKDGLAIVYPKDALTRVELLEDKKTKEPIVRLKAYLNLVMFGENNIFRMDGF